MEKRWFTILFRGPQPHVRVTKTNAAGDGVAWDGMSTLTEVQDAAHKLSQSCAEVFVSVGKDIGRQIAVYRNGVYVE